MSNQQPIFILPEGTQRTQGKNAQKTNIEAAKMVAETVRTTLGPKGMDKMLVDNIGDITITNDGVTILNEMSIEQPSAKMIVEVAKTQESEIGDGTTTAVVIAGELLKNAEKLLDSNVHPTIIAKGYRMATEKAMKILKEISEPVKKDDSEVLKKIATTAMTGKGAESSKERLADIAVKAVQSVIEKTGESIYYSKNDINIVPKVGGSIEESGLIEGIVLDKERVHSGMPRQVKDAKLALVDSSIEVRGPETDTRIQINDPSQLEAFVNQEEKMIKDMVERIVQSGANIVLCQKGIDDIAQHFLAKKGIFAIRRVKRSDMTSLAKATGAKIVTNLNELSGEDLGKAGMVEEVKVGEDDMVFIKECKNPRSVTILIKGATNHVVDEIKRAMEDAIGDVAATLTTGFYVAGAGAPEIEIARNLRKYSDSLSGREQLAVEAFADALEIIPKTLAENAGIDPIDIITELKAAHDKGMKWGGINVFTGKVEDSYKLGVIEPMKVKKQAISSASEVAEMILRIDDVIASSDSENQQQQPY
ncbi:MAG: thermosome subunit beta [Candidatus Woesearchaeota archaeon]